MTRPTLVDAGRVAPGRRLVVVSAGLSDPSSTRLLADLLGAAVEAALADRGGVEVEVVELRPLAHALTDALLTGFATGDLARAQEAVAAADGLVVVTPVFSGSYSGLFKTFFDVLEPGTLEDTPVLVAATAGTARHSLVLEHALRPLFAYLRADVVPTAVFAASEDWGSTEGDSALRRRIDRAAGQLADAVASRPALHRADPFGDVPDFSTLLGG
ncbi:MAG: hypothetical protein JWR20_1539 [Marmoricola sp.]|nr:hypothetical protein [Marmoricola sp.]